MKKILILALLILLTSQSLALTSEECVETGQQCAQDCEAICGQTKADYCEKFDYSGCALDVFCWCNACGIYDTKWCPQYPDYLSCAEGVKGTYRGCIENCQSKREGGQDVSTCWADCNEELNNKIIDCKQGPCQEFCTEKGFSNGEWAKYTQEYGWDSCYCTGEKQEIIEDIKEDIISDEDCQACLYGTCQDGKCTLWYMNGYPAENQGCGQESDTCCPVSEQGFQCNVGLFCSNDECKDTSQVKAGEGCGKAQEQCCTTEPNCKEGSCQDGKCTVWYMNGYPAEGQGCGYEGQNCCPDDTAGVACNIGLLCSNEQCTDASQVKAGDGCGKAQEQCCTTEPNCIEGGCQDGKCTVWYMNGYPADGQGCGYEGQNCCPDGAKIPEMKNQDEILTN